MRIHKTSIKLLASPKAVITLLLSLPGEDRVPNVVKRVERLSEDCVRACMEMTMESFAGRHRNLEQTFQDHFHKIETRLGHSLEGFSDQKKLLLGAYLTKEYSIQSAALFNPSVVVHPDQQQLKRNQLRFVMSLRATGEGHISSIVFQTGVVDRVGNISLDPPTGYFTRLRVKEPAGEISDTDYDLEDSSGIPLNEKVIFPTSKAESMGMEDVRFVKFEAEGRTCYYGTYTAYDGKQIRTKLIETENFASFRVRTLTGAAIADKGMALFPEKLDGKYVMISRQGGENINIMFSDNLYHWDEYKVLMQPKYTWELVQLGNCGSPIRTDKGWLLLTHGVGLMRTYVISAILLDLKDPTRIIGRLDNPLIEAGNSEREGYVPNVVYTCGLMRHGNLLMIPYAMSDSATGFITLSLDELLNQLIKS
ncbi:MAG TPA: glycoside hydrolase family 130 protein [Puia sp.]|nr:glycoside hydrolase family 130 protein [Puia sp.]